MNEIGYRQYRLKIILKYMVLTILITTNHLFAYNDPYVKYNKNIYEHIEKQFRLIEVKTDFDSNGLIDGVKNYNYDERGYLVSTTEDFGAYSMHYTYDTNGNLVSEYRSFSGDNLDLHHYSYSNGYLIKDIHDYNADGQFIEVVTYTYLSNSIIINHNQNEFSMTETYTYNDKKLAIKYETGASTTSYFYDSLDNMTSQIVSSSLGTTKRVFTYNVKNELIHVSEDNSNSIGATEIYNYDENGNVIELIKSGLYGNTTYHYKWENTENYGWLIAVLNTVLE